MKQYKIVHPRRGSLLLELCIFTVVLILLLFPLLPSGGTTVRTTNDNLIKDQALVLDNALYVWYTSHGGQYPNTLTVLHDMSFISAEIDLSSFSYSLQNNQTQYRLTANLNNGTTYKSLGSNY